MIAARGRAPKPPTDGPFSPACHFQCRQAETTIERNAPPHTTTPDVEHRH
jgi:hypothetical protein